MPQVFGGTAPGRGRGEETCVARAEPPRPAPPRPPLPLFPSAVGCGDLGQLKDSGPLPPQRCCLHPGRASPSPPALLPVPTGAEVDTGGSGGDVVGIWEFRGAVGVYRGLYVIWGYRGLLWEYREAVGGHGEDIGR